MNQLETIPFSLLRLDPLRWSGMEVALILRRTNRFESMMGPRTARPCVVETLDHSNSGEHSCVLPNCPIDRLFLTKEQVRTRAEYF